MIGVSIAQAKRSVGQRVKVRGFVHTIREQKTMFFFVLRDRTGMLQVAINKSTSGEELLNTTRKITRESTIAVDGIVTANPQVKLDGVEIIAESIELLSRALQPLPIDPWAPVRAGIDKRLDWRFLDLRTDDKQLIFKIQTAAERYMREWWYKNDFIEIHSPKLLGAASESGAELFELEYFGKKAYLAQSPQFYKQMAMAAGFERVFEIGPVFRANPSFTSRHDTEFTSVDVEISWIESHEDIMRVEENWLHYVIGKLSEDFYNQIKSFFGVEIKTPNLPFPRITLKEAWNILEKLGHQRPPNSKINDLDPGGERKIGEHFKQRMGSEFVFITDYPADVRPFYHMRHENEGALTKSFDLLWDGLEVTTGAQREHRWEILQKQAEEHGISTQSIGFYLDFFKYGVPPHGGYGFGLTRMLMSLLKLPNVREATYLYRGPNRLHP